MFKRCILYFVISIFSLVLVVYKESRYGYNKFKYEKKYKKGCDINDDLCYNENDDNVDNAKAIGKTENDYEVVNYDEYTNNNKKKSISLSNNKTKNKNYFDNYNNKYVDKNEINYIFKPYFEELNNNITKLDHVISLFYEFSINAKFFILIFFKSTMNILHSYGILLISLIKILFLWFIIIQPYIKWLFIKLKKSYMKLDYQSKKYIIYMMTILLTFLYLIYVGVFKYIINKISKIYKYFLKKIFRINNFLFKVFPYIISTLLYATIIKTIPIKCISFFIYSCFFPFPSIYSIVIILKYVYLPTLNTCIINKVEEKYHQKNQEKNQNQTKYQSVDTSTTSKEKHEYIRTQHHNSCTTNAGSCMQIQDVSETNEGLTLKKKYINGKDKDKEKDKEKEKKRETSKGMLKKITKKVTGKISKKTAQEGACENDVQEGACKNDVQEGACKNNVQEGACKNNVQEGACKNDVQEGACKNNVQEGEGHSQEINHHNIDQVDEIYDSSTEEECDHPVDYKDEKNEHLLNDQMDDGVEDYVEEYIEEQAKGENKICYKDINKNVHINHIHINDINQNNKKAMDEKNNYCISNFSFIKKKYSTLFGLESFNLRFRYKSKRENKSELSSSQYNQIGNERFSCASSVSFLNDEEGNILSYDVPILLEYWLFINILKFLKTAFFFHKFVKIPFLFEYFTLFVITINLSEKLHEFMFLKKYKSSILVRLLKNVLVTTVDFLLYFLFNVRLENEKKEEEKQNNNNNNNKKEYLERSNLLIKLSKIFKEKLKMNETVKFSFTCLKSIITENVVESVKLPLYIKICINILIYMPQLVLLIFPSFILKIYFLYIFFLAPIFGSLKCLEEKKEIHNKIYFICYFFFYNISSIVVNHSIFKCLPFYNLYKILITISVQTALKYIFNTLKLMS
ncbi:hypothetical protein PFAG_03803 [Plasmodium falciparum Santa Lucia]|uniref:Uncharacterized protein n=1 Tax=Plasmodium falciparum Santa Lucia TaxID=478859 RepID=W7FV36_PLAFA|nr:hypothetical protein PFAG_03803 [Plasmodium falciparum Santa Lucia]